MASALITLAQAFPATKGFDAKKAIASFDFSKVNVQDNSREDFLKFGLAPSFGPEGSLTSEAVKKMDTELKIMIAGTTKAIAAMPPADRTWDKIHAAFMQNPLLVADKDQIMRTDAFKKEGKSAFKFDGSPDAGIVKEVEAWFKKLIQDEDVLKSTGLNINVLAKIVAQTGATVDSFETFFYKNEQHSKTLVEIGVLRYPDMTSPYFKTYSIKLVAWSKSTRTLAFQTDDNGITGDYNCRIYRPRSDVIQALSQETKKLAVAQAEALFA